MRLIFIAVCIIATLVCVPLGCAQRQKERKRMDPGIAAKVPVVLRVQLIADEGGSKYSWDKVKLLEVLKNTSGYEFPPEFEIAHYTAEPGVPKGESTVYLERYNDTDIHRWKLFEGSAKHGVTQ